MAASVDQGDDPPGTEAEIGASQISDPDNYNVRRRLQQLHNAKERVADRADRTSIMLLDDPQFTEDRRNRLVAEAVAAFIDELDSLLRATQEELASEFTDEEVAQAAGEVRTIGEFQEGRGVFEYQDDGDTKRGVAPYGMSMTAYRTASEYLDKVAGPQLDSGLEVDEGFGVERGER